MTTSKQTLLLVLLIEIGVTLLAETEKMGWNGRFS